MTTKRKGRGLSRRARATDPETIASNRSAEELRNKLQRTCYAIVHYHYLTQPTILMEQGIATNLATGAVRGISEALGDLYSE